MNPFETDADFEMNFAVEMPEKTVGYLPDSDLASLRPQRKMGVLKLFYYIQYGFFQPLRNYVNSFSVYKYVSI